MRRLFFALWPDDGARAALAALGRRVAGESGGRAVPAANLHLTLAFLGDVPPERADLLPAVASAVDGAAFDLVLDRLGAFPRAGVGWVGPSQVPAALTQLQSALATALLEAGFGLEDRPFAPHLTLARRIVRAVDPVAVEPVAWRADRFALVESARGPEPYREVGSWRIGKGN